MDQEQDQSPQRTATIDGIGSNQKRKKQTERDLKVKKEKLKTVKKYQLTTTLSAKAALPSLPCIRTLAFKTIQLVDRLDPTKTILTRCPSLFRIPQKISCCKRCTSQIFRMRRTR